MSTSNDMPLSHSELDSKLVLHHEAEDCKASLGTQESLTEHQGRQRSTTDSDKDVCVITVIVVHDIACVLLSDANYTHPSSDEPVLRIFLRWLTLTTQILSLLRFIYLYVVLKSLVETTPYSAFFPQILVILYLWVVLLEVQGN